MTPDRVKLDAAIPSILSASKNNAVIEQLCFRPGFGERTYVKNLSVTCKGGVKGCRWSHTPWLKKEDGSGDPRIQVSILQRRVLDLVYKPHGDAIHPGDTFIVDMDLSHENLSVGTILQAGSAQLRVSNHWNNACVKWKVRYGVDALNWVREDEHVKYRLRGVLCEIVKDGTITNGSLLAKV
ncbi:MAG: hypothetical protein P8M25_18265 [Paracoccaceae bacterium]|nr:hypothetical protein [Paracoccaceae bacterium]